MEQTFTFSITLTQPTYSLLIKESRHREKSDTAVPSRTARQLIIERLQDINEGRPQVAEKEKDIGYGTVRDSRKPVHTEDQPKQKSKKPRKRGVDADESTPT